MPKANTTRHLVASLLLMILYMYLHVFVFMAAETRTEVPKQFDAPDVTELFPWRPKGLKLPSGWDARAQMLYEEKSNALSSIAYDNITFGSAPHRGEISTVGLAYLAKGNWEKDTFAIFEKYVNANETIVVDFGTWIGPTLLHHGSFSKHSFGIEADPVAYAGVEHNVNINRGRPWGKHITVESGCVSSPEDAGLTEMKARENSAGNSMSSIGEKVFQDNGKYVKWSVWCYTLPKIFEDYWGIKKPYKDVMIKVDVESYECKLIPSFYEWLKDDLHLPKMFISFHPQISPCKDDEYEGVLRFLRLYDHVYLGDAEEFLVRDATIDDFKARVNSKNGIVIYQNAHRERLVGAS
eukprot:CAMPEP_0183765900 /NCGR_PEP_ID=MMETSP0739-20130205/11220_1 /TAXON_ID=385413 /ORGANISM="Thalassiosira miniscula, Strain CCMP1093" /LENGTH=351 /DNA_ID=CAMNT_0026004621 /DNA_START=112 /DNA_END=1167 /DNA_ORIENTATION=+